ncbi:MAG: hypothetical protein ABI846_01340 [Rudaea sp.]
MNVHHPLRRSLVAFGITIAILVGAEAVAQISGAAEYPSALPTLGAVSVAPTCVAEARSLRKICYQANVVVGEPELVK